MKRHATFFSLLALLLSIGVFSAALAQTSPIETNHWYFGRQAGLRFVPPGPNGRPVPLNDATNLNAFEGTAAISNLRGRLLFYVGSRAAGDDFATVFNRRHEPMLGGTDLQGGSSSTQNALIVRQPGNTPNYFIFQVAQVENYGSANPGLGTGFYYSIVDTTRGIDPVTNEPLGEVVVRDQMLFDSTTEKVSAVMHRNGRWIWIMGHRRFSNEWMAFLLTENGVDPQPVISRVGRVHTQCRGALKFSPNGNRVACALTEPESGGHWAQVAQFNNLTGEVFDLVELPIRATGTGFSVYGVDFSPDNSKLYIGDRSFSARGIYQWDMCAGTSQAIIASRATRTTTFEPGQLQLGLDGAIYISKVGSSTSLAAFTAPNENISAAGFDATYIQLLPGTTADRGLTNVNQSAFNRLAPAMQYTNLCENDSTQFAAEAQCQGIVATYTWDFGDPASGAANTSTDQAPRHRFTAPGRYTVRVVVNAGNYIDSVAEDVVITARPRGRVRYNKLSCFGAANYTYLQDTARPNNVTITDYWWNARGIADTILEGSSFDRIQLSWNRNQNVDFRVIAASTTSLGEKCWSDTIRYRVVVNQVRGGAITGPDTVCLDPEVPFVFTSSDSVRTSYNWVYGPDPQDGTQTGQGTRQFSILNPTPGNKTLRVGFLLDTLNMTCFQPSPEKTFFVATPAEGNIFVNGDSSVCEINTIRYRSFGRSRTSRVLWGFEKAAGAGGNISFLSDTLADTVRVLYNGLSFGRDKYYITATEVSKDGCKAPPVKKEIWNACLNFGSLVTKQNVDGKNDNFQIENIENFPDNEVSLYNRWGARVFTAKGFKNSDVTGNLEPGTYFYHIRVQWEGRNLERRGWVEIMQ